ncbi:MAG: MlaD family protein [Proteobacteria bacterium]|jgi:phospholipid/cholesterol/gamma-HCH transport system substrate-binding protein|nr:MlaD family protein [Pseudomonadota bacterium]
MNDKKFGLEARVGIFAIIVIAAAVYASFKLEGWSLKTSRGYSLFVSFDSAQGLSRETAVRIAGVEIGKVESVELTEGGKARVSIRIYPGVELEKGLRVRVRSKGLLGDKYIEIVPPKLEGAIVKPGEDLGYGEVPPNFEDMMDDLSTTVADIRRVAGSLREALGDEGSARDLKEIIRSIRDASQSLAQMSKKNEKSIDEIVEGIKETVAKLREEGPGLLERADRITKNLDTIVTDNREGIQDTIKRVQEASKKLDQSLGSIAKITKDIESGRGTVGRLMKDDSLIDKVDQVAGQFQELAEAVERIKFFLGYQGNYLIGDGGEVKSHFSVRIQTKADKYYLAEIIDDPSYKNINRVTKYEQPTGGTQTQPVTYFEQKEGGLKYSLEMARRFYGLTLRGGLIESKGGVGMDYSLWKDRLTVGMEAFDFARDNNPVLQGMISFQLSKYIYLSGGYYDFVSKKSDQRQFYAGGGITFLDEDLKTLLPFIPTVK